MFVTRTDTIDRQDDDIVPLMTDPIPADLIKPAAPDPSAVPRRAG